MIVALQILIELLLLAIHYLTGHYLNILARFAHNFAHRIVAKVVFEAVL